jgi:hypothetical protein
VWGVSELRVKAKPNNKTEDLIQEIKEVMKSLDRVTVAKTFKTYTSRIEAVVIAGGHFVE